MNNKVDLSFSMSTGLGPETAFCVLYLLWISTYLCIQLSKNKKEIQHSNLTLYQYILRVISSNTLKTLY